MSRATMIVPVRDSRVLMGCCDSMLRMSFIGWFRLTATAWPPMLAQGPTWSRKRAGFFSSSSIKTPWSVILARTWRSALHETPMPTGQEAPCRGSLMTLASCTKYFPPYCAPMPRPCAMSLILSSHSTSRNARPPALPEVGRPSRYLQLASFTVLRVISHDRPPTARARWYGGQAAVPILVICSTRNSVKACSFKRPLVF
mmetsp:Transcript_99446/g.315629  ORF Transcript_99446/g.315629 Transcript_99446/m.315629 type:complete len:200 (+) Transcript_99446:167-766(+)